MNVVSKSLKFILALLFLFLGFLYLSHLQSIRGSFKKLNNIFTSPNIREKCSWSEKNNLLRCYRRDYLEFLRQADPYEQYLAFKLHYHLFERELVLQTSEMGQAYLILEHVDLMYLFMQITKEMKIRRSQMQVGQIILAHYYKDRILTKLYDGESLLGGLSGEILKISDPIAAEKLVRLKERYPSQLKKLLPPK